MIPLLLIILGLCLGSFVNAWVWRLRHNKDWVRGRSECTHCHHILGPLDLVPVLSWLLLRGKCRYCHKKIEDTPWVELLLPAFFLVSYYFWPTALEGRGLIEFSFWLVFLVGFAALALYDLRWYLLPNKIVFPLIGFAIIQIVVVSLYIRTPGVMVGAALGATAVAGTFYLIFQASRGTWIGGGDVKLGIVLGILAGGFLDGILLLFIASVFGVFAALPAILKGKAHRKMLLPFGPFLILGLIVVKLCGAGIINWYGGLFYV